MLRRWRQSVHGRLSQTHGLVRVLMKPRNGEPWTDEDRSFLWRELQRRWSPSLLLFHVPGMLPLFARLLDRRRARHLPRPEGRREGDPIGGAVG